MKDAEFWMGKHMEMEHKYLMLKKSIAENHWIKIIDRLPAANVDVVWSTIFGGIIQGQLRGNEIFCEVAMTWFDVDQFTHWMPLPKPPEGE